MYLESCDMFTQQRAAFRKNHSTQTSLLNITNQWFFYMDRGYVNGVIFLELKKAFDCVDRKILLKKLCLHGFRGRTLDWFQSYLTNSVQMCKTGQAISHERIIKCGVSHSSNLDPLLIHIWTHK